MTPRRPARTTLAPTLALAAMTAAITTAASAQSGEGHVLQRSGPGAAFAEPVPGAEPEARGPGGRMVQVGEHVGRMDLVERAVPQVAAALPEGGVSEALLVEPWAGRGDMLGRDDVVFLMRHGPTDWSKLDEKDVAPTDCDNQRIMSEEGRRQMREMGALMAANDVLPSRIVVSEWCRNQQTLEELMTGFDAVDPAIRDTIAVETAADLNLLLALQGPPDVQGIRRRVEAWDGPPEDAGRDGPLLLITHYTDIEELTTFAVYEGEILVVDPARDGRVMGFLRLASAAPDVGHFDTE